MKLKKIVVRDTLSFILLSIIKIPFPLLFPGKTTCNCSLLFSCNIVVPENKGLVFITSSEKITKDVVHCQTPVFFMTREYFKIWKKYIRVLWISLFYYNKNNRNRLLQVHGICLRRYNACRKQKVLKIYIFDLVYYSFIELAIINVLFSDFLVTILVSF